MVLWPYFSLSSFLFSKSPQLSVFLPDRVMQCNTGIVSSVRLRCQYYNLLQGQTYKRASSSTLPPPNVRCLLVLLESFGQRLGSGLCHDEFGLSQREGLTFVFGSWEVIYVTPDRSVFV